MATVQDARFRHVLVAWPDMNVTEAARLMRGRSEGALPVFEGTRLFGVVTISDLLDVLAKRKTAQTRIRARRAA